MLTQPRWIDYARGDRRHLRYVWDDARADEDFTGDSSQVLSAALKMSVRARLVLAIGMYEWITWRFDGLHAHTEPIEVLQAAWCATVDPRYLVFYEVEREDWTGPVEGPLWCAMTYLHHGISQGANFEGDLYDALELLYQLAVHVIADTQRFERWFGLVLARFTREYPVQPIDPLDDLFDHRTGELLGPLIGREALDPGEPTDLARDRIFLEQTLSDAFASGNTFLATPEDLEEAQFEGTPYVLPS